MVPSWHGEVSTTLSSSQHLVDQPGSCKSRGKLSSISTISSHHCTLMAASMQPKGRQTPAGVLKSALAATLASSAHAAALAPQFLGVAFSNSTIFAFFSCNKHASLVWVLNL